MSFHTVRSVQLAVFALIAALAGTSAQSQDLSPATIKVSELGPQVGEIVPDFSLPDQNGAIRTRASIMGVNGAMLVFVRSADWCPYCKTQLVELESQADSLRDRGYGLAVISYDDIEAIATFAERNNISFPMLSDVGSETIRRFGILNPVPEWAFGDQADDPSVQADIATYVSVVNPSRNMIGIAFPGTFMLDPEGRVTSRYFEDSYIERNTVSSIIMRTGANADPIRATQITTPQFDLTTYASEATIAPGNRFSLMLEITPKEGMHIYAPGAEDYQSLALSIESENTVISFPMKYPESTDYYFAPFDETVPVFMEPLALVQELVLDGSLPAQQALRGKEDVTVSGVLDYQACSDEICYPPASLELRWTIPLRNLVFR